MNPAKLPPPRHQRHRSQCRGQPDKHGLAGTTTKVRVNGMRDRMSRTADQVSGQSGRQRIRPNRGQQQGHPDAELERADIVQEMPVRWEVDEITKDGM
jgi:hypothetical protein